MTRLLSANFACLKKSRWFWNCMVFFIVYGISMVGMEYYSLCKFEYEISLDYICFDYANLMGFAAAVFVSMFLGTEYSDGTIRNKLTVGHKRHMVYLSSLIVSAFGVLMINLVYVGVVFLFGIPFLGFRLLTKTSVLLVLALLTILVDLAYTAVFTLFGMLNQNKATVVAAGILGVLMLCMFSGYVRSRLKEPKMFEEYRLVTDEGYVITQEAEEENPYYLEGRKREIYTFLSDFLPGSQEMQIKNRETERAWQMSLYSCLIMAVSTGTGILLFQRKDIR